MEKLENLINAIITQNDMIIKCTIGSNIINKNTEEMN